MPLRVACQMDPIEHVDIRGDSTFALLLEAQKRGHELFCYHPNDLSLERNRLQARGAGVVVRDKVGDHATIAAQRIEDLSTFDVVLLRQDPPFDMAYITNTHMLERIHPKTLVVNNPAEVRNAPEKIWVLDFPDLMPPTLITRQLADVEAFRRDYKDIIVKPLYGNGGAGVFRIQPNDTNLASLMEMFRASSREPVMVQEYRPEVRAGDKRIILVDGELAGALNRIPAEGETRSNLHVGGKAAKTELTDREREICARLAPELKRRGLIFTGIDVIGRYLTEINVTSPTGIRQIKAFGGPDIAAKIWDVLEQKRTEANATPASSKSKAGHVWLAVRRDHDGNLDILKMPDGINVAWDLTEQQADDVISYVQRQHRKPHGQSYWKLSYLAGNRNAFVQSNSIRV